MRGPVWPLFVMVLFKAWGTWGLRCWRCPSRRGGHSGVHGVRRAKSRLGSELRRLRLLIFTMGGRARGGFIGDKNTNGHTRIRREERLTF